MITFDEALLVRAQALVGPYPACDCPAKEAGTRLHGTDCACTKWETRAERKRAELILELLHGLGHADTKEDDR